MQSIVYRYRKAIAKTRLPIALRRKHKDAARRLTTQSIWGQLSGNQAPARCLRTEMAAPSQPSRAAKATIATAARQSGPLSWNTAP
jgi:hypothetical protein